jgi:RNA polymerase sigma-70 factor (ECF subfamily)
MKRQMTRTDSQIQNLEAHRPAIAGHVIGCSDLSSMHKMRRKKRCSAPGKAWNNSTGGLLLKNWLYRIATNVCLDEIHNRGRRARPMEEGPSFSGSPSLEDLVQRPAGVWIEPISDACALPSDAPI